MVVLDPAEQGTLLADTRSQKSWKDCHMNVILSTKAIYEVSFPLPYNTRSFLSS